MLCSHFYVESSLNNRKPKQQLRDVFSVNQKIITFQSHNFGTRDLQNAESSAIVVDKLLKLPY